MKTMKEMLENGYTVIIESMFGDMEITAEDLETLDIECYENDSRLIAVDKAEKVAHYEEIDCGQYDD